MQVSGIGPIRQIEMLAVECSTYYQQFVPGTWYYHIILHYCGSREYVCSTMRLARYFLLLHSLQLPAALPGGGLGVGTTVVRKPNYVGQTDSRAIRETEHRKRRRHVPVPVTYASVVVSKKIAKIKSEVVVDHQKNEIKSKLILLSQTNS